MKALLPALFWAIVITILSASPGLNLRESFFDIISLDKAGHAFVYGVFTILLIKGFSIRSAQLEKKVANRPMIFGLIISISYGILMEAMQYAFFPYRFFEYLDIFANIIGSFTGLLIFNFFNKKT